MTYKKALKTRNKITTIPAGLDREEVETSIAEITAILTKKGMSNAERIMLVHNRADLRDILDLMKAGGAQ